MIELDAGKVARIAGDLGDQQARWLRLRKGHVAFSAFGGFLDQQVT